MNKIIDCNECVWKETCAAHRGGVIACPDGRVAPACPDIDDAEAAASVPTTWEVFLSWNRKPGLYSLTDQAVDQAVSQRLMVHAGFGQLRATDGSLWAKHRAGYWLPLDTRDGKIVSAWYFNR